MANLHDPRQNTFLAALPADEYAQIARHLESEEMAVGDVLYETGKPLRHFHFPTTSIISLLYMLDDGASPEIAVIGREGVVGLALCHGSHRNPVRAVVQSPGHGYRIKAQVLMETSEHSAALMQMLLRYTQSIITQIAQTAVANGYHSIDQRMCRRLLLGLDRIPSNQLDMTHELIASMLGVRREGVTEAAQKLQSAGLIQYTRGKITVINREGLEARASGCYEAFSY